MRFRLNGCLALVCLVFTTEALPRKDVLPFGLEEIDSDEFDETALELAKRHSGEPTCDELRAMWRFSKRQSRASEITNEIPTYRDPFAVNVWDDYARPRSAERTGFPRIPVFGKLIATLPKGPDRSPERVKAFQEVFTNPERLIKAANSRRINFHRHGGGGSGGGRGGPLQPFSQGSFQHLKELIRNERARELQEQRLSEEAERNGGKDSKGGKYLFGQVNDAPPPAGNVIRNRVAGGYLGGRRTSNYPADLLAARYLYNYNYPPNRQLPGPRALNSYKPARLPDSSLETVWVDL